MTESSRITRFQVVDFKRIKSAEVKFSGGVLVVSGANGAGKSSLFDGAGALFRGPKAFPDKPVREGAKSAHLEADVTTADGRKLKIVRDISPDKRHRVRVQSADGATFSSPQSILDAMCGPNAIDPYAFIGADPAEQRKALADAAGLTDTLAELDRKRATAYDERRDINRDADGKTKQLAGLDTPPDDTPAEPVSVAKLMEERERLAAVNATNDKIRAEADAKAAFVKTTEQLIADEEDEILRIQESLYQAQERLKLAQQRRVEAVSVADTYAKRAAELAYANLSTIDDQIKGAEVINRHVELRARRESLQQEVDSLRQESEGLTSRLKAIDEEKSQAVAAAKLPIEGIEFTDDGVALNGIPLSQASESEQWRVAVALALSGAPVGGLRFAEIRRGSLLDANSRQQLAEIVEQLNGQVLVEIVAEAGEVGVHLEDGAVVAVDGKPTDGEQK